MRWEAIVRTGFLVCLFVKNYVGTQGEDVESKISLPDPHPVVYATGRSNAVVTVLCLL